MSAPARVRWRLAALVLTGALMSAVLPALARGAALDTLTVTGGTAMSLSAQVNPAGGAATGGGTSSITVDIPPRGPVTLPLDLQVTCLQVTGPDAGRRHGDRADDRAGGDGRVPQWELHCVVHVRIRRPRRERGRHSGRSHRPARASGVVRPESGARRAGTDRQPGGDRRCADQGSDLDLGVVRAGYRRPGRCEHLHGNGRPIPRRRAPLHRPGSVSFGPAGSCALAGTGASASCGVGHSRR